MDITRQLPSDVINRSGESEAVAVLHSSLVKLRNELLKRDKKIEKLESRLAQNDKEKKQLKFDELFELFDSTEDDVTQRKTAVDLEEILVADIEDDATQHQPLDSKKMHEPPCSDLVMDFVLEDEEKSPDELENTCDQEGRTFRLVPHRDIEIHQPPSSTISKTPIRPILKSSSSRTRSTSGSQTDITALRVEYSTSPVAHPSREHHSRGWVSEPSLLSPLQQQNRHGHSSSVCFLLPTSDSKMQVIHPVNKQYKSDQKRTTPVHGGRYSILDKNFRLKTEAKNETSHYSRLSFSEDSSHDETDFSPNVTYKTDLGVHYESSYVLHTALNPDVDSGSGSTDSLIEESQEFLRLAKSKLVTIDDWAKISNVKQIRRKIRKKIKHTSNISASGLSRSVSYDVSPQPLKHLVHQTSNLTFY